MTWACHETSQLMANIEYHDARTGEVQWGYSKNKDTGRSRSADIDLHTKALKYGAQLQQFLPISAVKI